MPAHTPSRGDQSPAASAPILRIGHGYDLHRLVPQPPTGPGRPLVIGGVHFQHDRGPVSHSDGDALLHAVTDALLGALALPDIGQVFPDDDPRHESRDSADFLCEALRLVRERGYEPVNVDATVILERPKLGQRKEEVRGNLARLLELPTDRVNVKGKTHEQVDAVGEGRAIEAHCVVLVREVRAT
ncbi:MAG: 2-C-methyl-D-erythritol 2,4-cyclodiphosphate synthase [Leptolyngbya sp. PLA3]|nr:MAG: 2-C-methyl-D-erythritol 2,4-cyclodiphosphate synthase [Cyanobacteria bacterium CYA]MCE7967384.1 2-C-methyl-D-erythritol 2,4-cyclodiphosphate synthase [Leptolyngbya sp. PL-A3]